MVHILKRNITGRGMIILGNISSQGWIIFKKKISISMPPEELKIRKNFIDFNGTKKYYNAPCLYWKWDLPELCYKSWYEKKYRDVHYRLFRSKIDELKLIYEVPTNLIKVSFVYKTELKQEDGKWKEY